MAAASSLFRLATAIVELHGRSSPGKITVVPVLVDDLVKAMPVLTAICDVMEGRLFDYDDSELQASIPGTSDMVRRTAIDHAMNTQSSGGTRRVTIVEDPNGTLNAEYRDPPAGPETSAGEYAVLAVARAVAHEELDNREFAIIAYPATDVDYQFRRCLWSLAVDHLINLPHGTLRTLVFVTETAIDIDLHCQTGRGFRYALRGERLLRRHVADDLRVQASRIAKLDQPVVFFLGAGFGASAKLPLGNTLRDSALRRLLAIPEHEEMASQELAERFHKWISERDGWMTESEMALREDEFVQALTLEQVIRAERRVFPELPTLQEFRQHHDSVLDLPGSAAIDLAYVLGRLAGKAIVVEVNFDQLVERHCPVPTRVFHTDDGFNDAATYIASYLAGDEEAIPVLKLHGSIEDPESCVVSDEQTQRGVGAGKLAALRALLNDDSQRSWIYIGASLRDRDLLPILSSEEFSRGTDERFVSPFLEESVEEFSRIRKPHWRDSDLPSIDDRFISETADAFFDALKDELG